ncbi:MAG: UDP-glucose 6-dehydrogenase [Thermodesulfobacteriota bacterium]|nr:UDP-glucose 6-dehydrogenase [Thermodesulfobacteriota bacterium]
MVDRGWVMVDEMKRTIGVIGLWHLGCVLCAAWSRLGNKVAGFDYDRLRVEELRKGNPPLFEPGLGEAIQEGIRNENLTFSEDIACLGACDFVFLSYDTPVGDDDESDTSILERAVDDAKRVMKEGAVLIVSSQSPVGFCGALRSRLQEENATLDLAYSPENLRLGEAIACYLNPGRIILGTNSENAREKCAQLFSQIEADVLTMNLESAEMVKHGINSFLSMCIVFANHLSDICETTGACIDDVVKGMKTDPRIGPKAYLSPGIGFSGGTLGRDLQVLRKKNVEAKRNATIFGIIHDLNHARKQDIVCRLEELVGGLMHKRIGVLGLTYKPGTSTLRRSLPVEISDLIIEKGAEVKVYDPKADYAELQGDMKFEITHSIEAVAEKVDALILLTEWGDFKTYPWGEVAGRLKKPVFFDTKNFLDQTSMKSCGFQYYSIGR